MEKKFFRPNRGLYADSMEEKIELSCLEGIRVHVESDPLAKGYYENIRIAQETKRKHREPNDEWGKDTYMVLADFKGYTGQCIGFTNFCDVDVTCDEQDIEESQNSHTKADTIILLGKPLSEYPETSDWLTRKIKQI